MNCNERFLRGFFDKLTLKSFNKYLSLSKLYKRCSTNLFDFYMTHLLRHVIYNEEDRLVAVADLCDRLKVAIVGNVSVKRVSVNKKKAMLILSKFVDDSEYVTTLSERFLVRFFDKLSEKNFVSDPFLKGFYQSYMKDQEKFKNQTLDSTQTLFDFYMEYLLRNVSYSVEHKHIKIAELCAQIKNEMFMPDAQGNKPMTSTNDNLVHNVTLNKKKALMTLRNFIKASNIVTYDNPDETTTVADEDFRVATTANIIKEIKASGKTIPKAQLDAAFNRRNELLSIWHDTEHKCVQFINNDALASVLKKVYFVDGTSISQDSTHTTTLLCRDLSMLLEGKRKELMATNTAMITAAVASVPVNTNVSLGDIESDLPIEIIASRRSANTYTHNVHLVNDHALTEVLNRKSKTQQAAYICSGSQMVPGGCADQGVETNESIIYLSSSYHLCIEQVDMAYPLKPTQMLVMPSVLVFKDHTKEKYPTLPPAKGQGIAIIMAPGIYRPETKSQTLTDRQPLISRYRAMFNTALFFGYDTVILDDQGVLDFCVPAHQTAQLLVQVINEFKNRFREVVVAIKDKDTFAIFRQYM